jgi:peroxiredoxin
MDTIADTKNPLGVGDAAPDFALPAADAEGTIALAEYRQRGPVLLILLRGLYCPFCRRNISMLRPTCEALRAAGVSLLGVVIGSPTRTRQYFRHFPACFPMAAAPDRTLHRAYGLPAVARAPEHRTEVESNAVAVLRALGIEAPTGEAAVTFAGLDGFEMTEEDDAEWKRPLQAIGYFLVGRDGLIRWARVDQRGFRPLPTVDEILPLL